MSVNRLLPCLPALALCAAGLCTTEVVPAGCALLLALALPEVVLGDPLFLITSSTSGSDGTNRRADRVCGGDLLCSGFLGLGNEGCIGEVDEATEKTSDDGIGR